MKKPNGFVFYTGPSMLDGAPIVAIATLESSNAKTGNMVQTWILRQDVHPVEAAQTGLDAAICGGCPHRRYLGGACYVNIGQGPGSVWKAWQRGAYADAELDADLFYLVRGRKLRMGAYGDPAAVPFERWSVLAAIADDVTGYTHQASHPNFDPQLLDLCMVSADTPKQAAKLQSKGHRTFRVKTPDSPALPGEIECLSDSKGLQCADCMLCHGGKTAANVYINVHGSLSSRYVNKYGNANLIAVAA